ncbi:hypothetical protein CASFOL_037312 [Castilleja foliolosa]|uniref:Uncharacterized protein n=1 Tax=Castilleja foliolosa TaxID=1961234 RepID=A0ABD3BNZ5_9LAMI
MGCSASCPANFITHQNLTSNSSSPSRFTAPAPVLLVLRPILDAGLSHSLSTNAAGPPPAASERRLQPLRLPHIHHLRLARPH